MFKKIISLNQTVNDLQSISSQKSINDTINDYNSLKNNKINNDKWNSLINTSIFKFFNSKSNESMFLLYIKLSFPIHSVFKTMTDLKYRKTWDNRTISIDQNKDSIIQWIVKYPFPYSNREYNFKRNIISQKNMHIIEDITVPSTMMNKYFNTIKIDNYRSYTIINKINDHTTDYFISYESDGKLGINQSMLLQFIMKNIYNIKTNIELAIQNYSLKKND